jgi:SOS-response transcriptional repressor LexA
VSSNGAIACFFPRPPVLVLVRQETWRDRLRAAIERTGRKHSAIARDAGIAPATLSRILTSAHVHPTLDTVVRVARAANENVGWLLDEPGFALSDEEQQLLRRTLAILQDALAVPGPAHVEPNAFPAGRIDIPRAYAARGARLVYQAAGDSMIGAGIADGDILFVKPAPDPREAARRIVVCRIGASEYVKVFDVRGGRKRLLSRNDRYPPMELDERHELVGIVIGRIGPIPG